jgi:hypothetical protein
LDEGTDDADSFSIQYVDDVVGAGEKADVDEMIEKIKGEFVIDDRGNMDEGMLLGMEVKRDRIFRTITLSQSRYARDILERFGMANVRPARTPMDEHNRSLSTTISTPRPNSETPTKANKYLQAVGSLMYLRVSTRPDLTHTVGVITDLERFRLIQIDSTCACNFTGFDANSKTQKS